MLLGPALVLRLEDAAGVVPEAHQGRESPARHRAVGLEQRAAVGDGDGLAAVQLMDRAVAGDEEAPFREVVLGRRRREGNLLRDGSHGRGDTLGQMPDGGGERHGEIPPGDDAVAGVVEPVLAAPGSKNHLWVIEKVAIDRDQGALDGKWLGLEPGGVGVAHWLAWRRASAGTRCPSRRWCLPA